MASYAPIAALLIIWPDSPSKRKGRIPRSLDADRLTRRIIDYSGGPRNAVGRLYRDDRILSLGPSVLMRVRRGF